MLLEHRVRQLFGGDALCEVLRFDVSQPGEREVSLNIGTPCLIERTLERKLGRTRGVQLLLEKTKFCRDALYGRIGVVESLYVFLVQAFAGRLLDGDVAAIAVEQRQCHREGEPRCIDLRITRKLKCTPIHFVERADTSW